MLNALSDDGDSAMQRHGITHMRRWMLDSMWIWRPKNYKKSTYTRVAPANRLSLARDRISSYDEAIVRRRFTCVHTYTS